LRQLVVDKFNSIYGCSDYEALKENIDYKDKARRQQANDIINSIRICDPAVGSGHFLVAALNELIAIKRDLRILQDCTEEHRRIEDYDIKVENDELVITDGRGKLYQYDPVKQENKLLQESLFEEKRIIIENCLFGVDLNPNSVEICRLRLWIELLKSAYYIKYGEDRQLLQTLPNIDINIKVGNSLSSAFAFGVGKALNTTISFTDS
jgi:type II restriction/modification system DNA methylase subunit YeeA